MASQPKLEGKVGSIQIFRSTDQNATQPTLAQGDVWIRNGETPTVVGGSREGTPPLLSAYLQTPGQERALFPGGSLTGKVHTAVIEPFFAISKYSEGYTLADIKAANPGMKVLAYVNGAMVQTQDNTNGVFSPSVNLNDAIQQGWVFSPNNPSVWTGSHASKVGTVNGKKYIRYTDYASAYLADISKWPYMQAFITLCQNILTTASISSKGAPNAYFDGLFLDDTNMSPQHGLDLDATGGSDASSRAPEKFGPWSTNDDYGSAMVNFVRTVSDKLRYQLGRSNPIIMCNIGAHPWLDSQRNLAFNLAEQKIGGGPAVDRMLREFTTGWYAYGSNIATDQIIQIIQMGADLAARDVAFDFSDQAKPVANPQTGPTTQEQQGWNKQQRLLSSVALLARCDAKTHTFPNAQAAMVHEGRNQWNASTYAQDMGAKVADLADSVTQRWTQSMSVLNIPIGPLTREGDVVWRKLDTGTVYANFGTSDKTVNGVKIPARDAVIA